jgi:hypothetical protein
MERHALREFNNPVSQQLNNNVNSSFAIT